MGPAARVEIEVSDSGARRAFATYFAGIVPCHQFQLPKECVLLVHYLVTLLVVAMTALEMRAFSQLFCITVRCQLALIKLFTLSALLTACLDQANVLLWHYRHSIM